MDSHSEAVRACISCADKCLASLRAEYKKRPTEALRADIDELEGKREQLVSFLSED